MDDTRQSVRQAKRARVSNRHRSPSPDSVLDDPVDRICTHCRMRATGNTFGEREPSVREFCKSNGLTLGDYDVDMEIDSVLRAKRMPFPKYISVWLRHGRDKKRMKALRAALLDDEVLLGVLDGIPGDKLVPAVSSLVRAELSELSSRPMFCPLKEVKSSQELDVRAVNADMDRYAPVWKQLLDALLGNQRKHWPSYNNSSFRNPPGPGRKDEVTNQGRRVLLTSVVLGGYRSRTGCGIRTLLGIMLKGTGLSRSGIDNLAGFGVCPSYNTVNREFKNAEARGEVSPTVVVIFVPR